MRFTLLLCTLLVAFAIPVARTGHVDVKREASRSASYRGFGPGSPPPASWRPYAPSSPFNRRLSRHDPAHPRSAAIVRRTLSWGLPADLVAGHAGTRGDYDHPIYFARRNDPVATVVITRSWGRNPLAGKRIRVPGAARPAGGTDGHLTVVQPNGWEYDFWEASPPRGGRLVAGWGGRVRIDGDGRRSGATAAGFGSAAGIIRAAELRAGRINHALALVVRCTGTSLRFGFGVNPARPGDHGSAFVYPASKGATACGGNDPDAPPTGARFRLALSPREIAHLRAPRWKKAVLRALARYGAYVTDTGGPGVGLLMESSNGFTSSGHADPLMALARRAHVPAGGGGTYRFDISSGVDWGRRLQVVAPPRPHHRVKRR